MNIQKLKLKNFFSYEDAEIDFSKPGIYLLYGQNKQTKSFNGVGKSAIKEAIKYVLFGKCRTDSIDDAIRFGTTKMEVIIRFEMKGRIIEVRRTRERGKGTKILLTVDGEDKTRTTLKQTDELIEKIIGVDYDKFMHSFCFGQSPYDDLKEMTSTRLIDFLKNVLKLERFNDYLEKTKQVREKISDELLEISSLIKIHSTISEQEDKEKIKKELKEKEKKLSSLLDKISKLELKLRKQNAEWQAGKSQASVIFSKINELKKRITFIKKNSSCPLCKRPLKSKILLKELEEKEKKNLNETRQKEKELNKIEKELERLDNKRDDFLEAKASLEGNISNLKSKLENSVDKKIAIEEVNKKNAKLLKQQGIIEKTVDVFSSKGLPLYILNTFIPKLELSVNLILEKITDFKLNLKTKKKLRSSDELRDTCEIELMKGNKIYPLENLSNGEEFLITLAVRIGISKLYHTERKFETLILDECFGSLGDNNRKKVMVLIESLTSSFKKIIVISHITEVRNWEVPYKINIIKDRGISYIENRSTNL